MRIGWKTDNPPCEEDYYLVQYKGGSMDVAYWTNTNPICTDFKTTWHWRCAQYCEVVAWLPLPEPYKETTNEDL